MALPAVGGGLAVVDDVGPHSIGAVVSGPSTAGGGATEISILLDNRKNALVLKCRLSRYSKTWATGAFSQRL